MSNYRFVRVASSNMLQHAPTTAPTHSIKCVGMSKSNGRSILQHIGACDANKSYVSATFSRIAILYRRSKASAWFSRALAWCVWRYESTQATTRWAAVKAARLTKYADICRCSAPCDRETRAVQPRVYVLLTGTFLSLRRSFLKSCFVPPRDGTYFSFELVAFHFHTGDTESEVMYFVLR